MTEKSGLILHLQRLSTEDGPGIRTTVFFKGCPLQCEWCHNPESLSSKPQVQWLNNRCIGCETCIGVCTQGGLSKTNGQVQIDRQICNGCGVCAEACPANALELLGSRIELEFLLDELLKDRAYYQKSCGGVTLSGGEPTMQAEFSAKLLRALKDEGIHTALDTCGLCSTKSLEKVLPHTDLILFDIKEMDPERHRQHTGQSNQIILKNLLLVRDFMSRKNTRLELWLRTPLIPGRTDSAESIQAAGDFIARNLDGYVARWELNAFNNLCRDKYKRLDISWPFADQPLLNGSDQEALTQVAKESGVDPNIVIATGTTRVDV